MEKRSRRKAASCPRLVGCSSAGGLDGVLVGSGESIELHTLGGVSCCALSGVFWSTTILSTIIIIIILVILTIIFSITVADTVLVGITISSSVTMSTVIVTINDKHHEE